MNEKLIKCPGCGANFPNNESSPHRYGVASAGCWQAFNELLAHERMMWGYPDVHRLIVDAYSIQHPQNQELQKKLGISQRFIDASIQSVAVHLIALYFALTEKKKLNEISKLMDRILSKGAIFQALIPPKQLGKITIAYAPKGDSIEEYRDFAWKWAREAWTAWSQYHGQVEQWIDQYLD
ncbi:MAG: hypothetical protein K940chlam6_00426 [Chlamydiae bacterium]|nr:hypothetical protein [Chlamydiota bacterium]